MCEKAVDSNRTANTSISWNSNTALSGKTEHTLLYFPPNVGLDEQMRILAMIWEMEYIIFSFRLPFPLTGLITFTWKARWDEAVCSFVPKTDNIENILTDFQMISKVVFFSFPFCCWIWELSWFYLKNGGIFQREEEMERVSFKALNVLIHQC